MKLKGLVIVVKKISTGYIPREWQAKTHALLKRHNVLVFHRRGGKSVFAVNEIIDRAIFFDKLDLKTGEPLRNPHFAFVATTIGQVEMIAWQYFKEYCADIPGVKFNNQKLRITFPHPRGLATIYLFGAENFEAMRGIYLDGYVLDEYADMHPDVRDKVLLPTLSDRKGWEIIIGTPKGENAFKDIYTQAIDNPDMWFSCLYKASETDILDDDELIMLKRSMSDEAYRQEYECDFNAAPSGKYYQTYIDDLRREGKICSVPHDNSCLVSTFWDLGHSDSTTIWFIQEVGREIRVINYYAAHGKGIEHYIDYLNELESEGRYRYNEHVLPHDANHHSLQTNMTMVDRMEELGLDDIRVLPKTPSVAEDIHCVRQVLPKCWFDLKNCAEGLKGLAAYERKWDPRQRVYSDKPLHNWASDPADAFRQFAVDYEPGFGRSFGSTISDLPQTSKVEYNILEDF